MKNYQYILFDLDGTLTDPGIGITNSVMYSLNKFGITVTDRESLYPFIGPPLMDSFAKYYGMSETDCRLALERYREYFRDRGIFENEVYDGVPELLAELKNRGKTVILATSKPEVYARRILEHFGLIGFFDFTAGATFDESRVKKEDVIRYALTECGVTDPSAAVMVGDREQDIRGASLNGLAAVGVTYGYGSVPELSGAGAAYLAATPNLIGDYVCGISRTHRMRLDGLPFRQIKSGEKTTELRLYDEKRRRIKPGDVIEFTCRDSGDILTAEVTAISVFSSFRELCAALPAETLGWAPGTAPEAAAAEMRRYYTADDEKKYGVAGIGVKVLRSV